MVFYGDDFWYSTGFTGFRGFFLSPFPDERVKTNPPAAEEVFVRSMMCLRRPPAFIYGIYSCTGSVM